MSARVVSLGVTPPVSSTGAEITPDPAVSLGWLQGTVRIDAPYLLGVLGQFFGAIEERGYGLQWYRRSATVGAEVYGVRVGWEPRSEASERDECLFVIPQGALDVLGWEVGGRLARHLFAMGARFSRVDVAYDDYRRVVDPVTVYEAFEAGRCVTHTRFGRLVGDTKGGATAYIGSRQSAAMVRVYRKWVEAADPSQGVRWEAELKGERSGEALRFVLDASSPGVAFMSLVRGVVDFRERVGVANGDRAPLVEWWASLIDGAGRAVYRAAVKVMTVARQAAWLRRQVAPGLAWVVATLGDEWFAGLLHEGRERAARKPVAWSIDWSQGATAGRYVLA